MNKLTSNMNFPIIITAVLALPLGAQSTVKLRFNNGDSLSGSVTDIKDDRILWNSSAFLEPEAFKRDNISEITLSDNQITELPEGNHIAIVTLTNGDELRGNLLNVDEKSIVILTSFGGELTFRRDMVEKLRIADRPELIYSGPTGLDGWIQSQRDSWSYEDGTLICERESSIGRDIGKHSKIHISFDISWEDAARFRLHLHADNEDVDDIRNGYELVCQSQYAYMRKRVTRNGQSDSTTIGTAGGIRELDGSGSMRLDVYHDTTTGRVRFMLDGRVVADWRDPTPPQKTPLGKYLHLNTHRSNGTRISRIHIQTWDGTIEGEWKEDRNGRNQFFGMPQEREKEEDTPQDESGIKLRNGDKIEGKVLGINEGIVELETPFKTISLPVPRLRTFAIRTAEEAADPEKRWEPIRREGDIRAWFHDGGSITFQLISSNQDTLVGKSQTFGEATFNLQAFERLEFNLYR